MQYGKPLPTGQAWAPGFSGRCQLIPHELAHGRVESDHLQPDPGEKGTCHKQHFLTGRPGQLFAARLNITCIPHGSAVSAPPIADAGFQMKK